ncbi:hypothetical protein [Peribacillus simplex]|uniref:Uncharacterized protein n=1 Tax=Peribacillus simplex TaxID=1478 RepID=A0AAW7ILJ5_9BACI|nr:hypothetical protein [Peribacillus simplex]MDM5455040.1 hypothetical protein [Peribacillus simplex]
MLEPFANLVKIAHRRGKFRAHEHSVENHANSDVQFMTPSVPIELRGEEEIDVVLENVIEGEEEIHKADAADYGL